MSVVAPTEFEYLNAERKAYADANDAYCRSHTAYLRADSDYMAVPSDNPHDPALQIALTDAERALDLAREAKAKSLAALSHALLLASKAVPK